MDRQRNDKKVRGNNILIKRMVSVFGGILLLHIIIFTVILLLTGSVYKVRQNSYKQLQKTIALRGTALEEFMLGRQHEMNSYRIQIETKIGTLLETAGKESTDIEQDSALNNYVLQNVAPKIKEILSMTNVTGTFIVLNRFGSSSDLKSGLYIRNTRPLEKDVSYYTVLCGSTALAEKIGVRLHENWRSDFRITNAESCFYYTKLYDLLETQPQYSGSGLGYWSQLFSMYGDAQKIITYSVPLVDSQNRVFGVMGIEISTEMLDTLLPYTELGSQHTGSYYLAYGKRGEAKYDTGYVSSENDQSIVQQNGQLQYDGSMIQNSIYHIQSEQSKEYVGTVRNLRLYSPQSPFFEEQWVLVGTQKKSDLLSDYRNLMRNLVLAISISCIFSFIGFFYYSVAMNKKLRQLIGYTKLSSPENRHTMDKGSVGEFGELADAFEKINEKIGISSSKLAEIISMVKVPVGAIEYCKEEPYVFCTESACEILELHFKDKENQYIPREIFEAEGRIVQKKLVPYEKENDTYRMASKNGKEKWIRIAEKKREGRILIAVLDISHEILEKQKIEYERDYDILTRLLNRNAFREKMAQTLKKGNIGVGAVVMMDLDNLKYFNDTYGHDYGDKYIREAAAVLSTMNQHNALVSRMSGDEFLIFISGYSNKDEIRKLIIDVHKRLMDTAIWVPSGEQIKLRASAGIAWYPDDGIYLDELLRYADFAMYEIKGSIKGHIKEFNRETYQKDALLLTGQEELNQLIDDPDAVRYAFQPIVDALTGEVFGYEALMRPKIESLRSPGDVLRLAKAQSKLYQIECMTWIRSLAEAEKQRKLGDSYRIFINSVPNHMILGEDLHKVEEEFGHLLERVVVEIIENEQTDRACMEIKRKWAKKNRAQVALDDFGTGYSNESTLLYINPSYVKIDMSLIKNIHMDESRQKIVQNLLAYTKSHNMKVIAEGIDSYEEMEALISYGVDYLQGWYLAKGQFEILDISPALKEQVRQCARKYQKSEEKPI